MESYGNERQVQQGENWNLDLLISSSNSDYIPFIIGSQRSNPFFVVTVASTKFEKNLRYVKSWWNSPDNLKIPLFYDTNPVYCGQLNDDDGDELPVEPGEGTFSTYTVGDSSNTRYLYQYIKQSEELDPSLSHKPYHYFYFDYNNNQVTRIDNYDCRVTFNFLSSDTAEWTGQNYMYQLTLVDGQLMADKLQSIYDFHVNTLHENVPDWPDNIEDKYKYVKVVWPGELQPDIDIDSPLGQIDVPIPILPPTKLEVFNNLRTLI